MSKEQVPFLEAAGRSYYLLNGQVALTPFRCAALLTELQAVAPGLTGIKAHFLYCIASQDRLTDTDYHIITQALPLDEAIAPARFEANSLMVWPRLGTLSPWSSRALDIMAQAQVTDLLGLERGVLYQFTGELGGQQAALGARLSDAMTESVLTEVADLPRLFALTAPRPLNTIALAQGGKAALLAADQQLGLALSDAEMDYLLSAYGKLNRDPTDAELMMFAQVNSEHCRHKIFNARWTVNGAAQPHSLFQMIRHTYQQNPNQALVAYDDNAAVLKGHPAYRFVAHPTTHAYQYELGPSHLVLKVETHNHPTAISPNPGAATGSGGEIRDEAATGRGARAKMGLVGFSVSPLNIPGYTAPYETALGYPAQMQTALTIMQEAPIGAAAFNNEFGRPGLCGYFRTLGLTVPGDGSQTHYGYHKPIMLAGGVGQIRETALHKQPLSPGDLLIVLGGPAMHIGIGGGAASSRVSDESHSALDFASVQRANPEMQRRCQEVIDACAALGERNPILSIHDVGAGGLSNALPELVEACDLGAVIDLRSIPNVDQAMSPAEIWCNEAQERYVLAIRPESLPLFEGLTARERCLFAVVGEVTQAPHLRVVDTQLGDAPVELPLSVLLGDLPRWEREATPREIQTTPLAQANLSFKSIVPMILGFPCVADKTFLITIADRSVTGLVARDQMVGPWQVPVSDVAVTASDYRGYQGEALAMGERAPVAILNSAAAARLAVGEAITNIAAAAIPAIESIALSANWMAAPDAAGQSAALYEAVEAIGLSFCPELGVSIPVGKDSLSMQAEWKAQAGTTHRVTSPVSLVVSAAAPVSDIRATLTPVLNTAVGETDLLCFDLGLGSGALGGSVLAQTQGVTGDEAPDAPSPAILKSFFQLIQTLNAQGDLLAYHDRSDGGLLATLAEMMFAGQVGVTVCLEALHACPITAACVETLGAVVQVRSTERVRIQALAEAHQLGALTHWIGSLNQTDTLRIEAADGRVHYEAERVSLRRYWSELSYRMQALRDHPDCAKSAFDSVLDPHRPGLSANLTFNIEDEVAAPYYQRNVRPRIAILREQGVNGHMEMAAAFESVGFESVDVTMSDLLAQRTDLSNYQGLAACGGFSYGDVLGAGRGWATAIRMNPQLHDMFAAFFTRDNTFTLGVCNGCQMLSQLADLIPGAAGWPRFARNESEQFEARLSLVQVTDSPSIFFSGMQGAVLPVPVAHGEGRVCLSESAGANSALLPSLRYVDTHHRVATTYPDNPNGSPEGLTAVTSRDGRATIMMPHPERVFRAVQFSTYPAAWAERSPWHRFFANARVFVD